MRWFVGGIVFLSQTLTPDLSSTTWPGLILAVLGGSAGVAVLHKIIAEHLREKREDARRQADEDKLRRDAKSKAEVDQIEALSELARDVPRQFREMTDEFRKSNELMRKELAENTRAVNGFAAAWNDEKRVLLAAIAQKLGVQTNEAETNLSARRASQDPSSQARPSSPSSPLAVG